MRDPSDGNPRTPQVFEGLERRIVRRLDGESGEAAARELDRELVRDPAAHRMMDEYAAVDQTARDALRTAFARQGGEQVVSWAAGADRLRAGASRRRTRAAVAAAIAAVVAACILIAALGVWRPGRVQPGRDAAQVAGRPRAPHQAGPLPPEVEAAIWQAWQAVGEGPSSRPGPPGARTGPAGWPLDALVPLPPVEGPRQRRQAVDRQLFTVWDESGNAVYLLGVDRVRMNVHAVRSDL